MIDVTNPPGQYAAATGDGITDDTQALQNLINADPPLGALYFPTGKYRITDVLYKPNKNVGLIFPPRTGQHIVGSGMAARQPCDTKNQQSTVAGARAALVWDGPDGGTMIEYGGTGLIWEGLALWGSYATGNAQSQCPTPSANPRAGIGIKITKPSGATLNPGKMWLPAIHIDNCATGILVDGANSADSCAFGYVRTRFCGTFLHLDGAGATMYTFRFVLANAIETSFKVTGGGRIYVHCINITGKQTDDDKVLDVSGGDMTNSFFHIGGLKTDAQANDLTVLRNVDSGDGNVHVRFTDARWSYTTQQDPISKVLIDRRNGHGQTILEFVGCKDMTQAGKQLTNNVVIKGASGSKPSRLIVRDSEIGRLIELVEPTTSTHYTDNRINNWLFGTGVEDDIMYSG